MGACTPSCELSNSEKPAGKPAATGAASAVGFCPELQADSCRKGLAQLSGATLAHTKSAASRAHANALRATSSHPSPGDSYFEQLTRHASKALFGHFAFTLSHISKHTS